MYNKNDGAEEIMMYFKHYLNFYPGFVGLLNRFQYNQVQFGRWRRLET